MYWASVVDAGDLVPGPQGINCYNADLRMITPPGIHSL